MITLDDALGRTVTLSAPARRIISLVPSQTELLATLGLDEEVVGITRFCVRPPGWKSAKRIVGGTKTLRTDRVERLRPDLILANLEENTRSSVEALEAIAPVFVTHVQNLKDACSMIDTVARLTGRESNGRSLRTGIEVAFEDLPSFRPLRAAYLIWQDPLMTVGRDTFIHDMMARGGLMNAFGALTRYPSLTETDLIDASLDVLLLPDEPYPFDERHAAHFQRLLPGAAVLRVDGQAYSWYGSRLIHTPSVLRRTRETLGA